LGDKKPVKRTGGGQKTQRKKGKKGRGLGAGGGGAVNSFLKTVGIRVGKTGGDWKGCGFERFQQKKRKELSSQKKRLFPE